MTIKELHTDRPNPFVTVTFSYEEVRDIANALYERCRISDSKEYVAENKDYLDVYKKAATLFELVKNGKITSHLLGILNIEKATE